MKRNIGRKPKKHAKFPSIQIADKYYYIKFVRHAFNSHVSTSSILCINKAVHMLLVYRLGTISTLIKSLHFMTADPFNALVYGLALKMSNHQLTVKW